MYQHHIYIYILYIIYYIYILYSHEHEFVTSLGSTFGENITFACV